MPRLKILSGREAVDIFKRFSFVVVAQRGSHVKLRRVMPDGNCQSLTIPLHKELDRGTLYSIYRKALLYVSENELRPYFYSE